MRIRPSFFRNVVKLYIGGMGLRGDGYPNAARTVALLRRQDDIEVIDCGRWLPEDLHLWKVFRMPRWRALRWLVSLTLGNLRSLLLVCARIRSAPGPVYVPYPGVFFLLLVSLLPRRWRPACIVDSYISIWDSMFRDRAAGKARSGASKILKRLESRALRAATVVLVDTEANRDVYIAEFCLDPANVRSIPLAIDEERFLASSRSFTAERNSVRVLFVGTLIPLHGIQIVLDALAQLLDDTRFEFRLIGDGQQADRITDFIRTYPSARVTWIREWCTLDRITEEIADADICLGVFGGEGKAARVLPFKLYMYLAGGRAIISQPWLSTPQGAPFPPIETSNPDPAQLSTAIRRLADDPERRARIGRSAAEYYGYWLANSRVVEVWHQVLDGLNAQSRR
jgi:glycosyltransferase involved in cell wall biosynthesis